MRAVRPSVPPIEPATIRSMPSARHPLRLVAPADAGRPARPSRLTLVLVAAAYGVAYVLAWVVVRFLL